MNIVPTNTFDQDVRDYIKKKKYRHIEDDLYDDIFKCLINDILIGDEIKGFNLSQSEHVYKARAKNTSVNVGKTNGFRLIYLYSESLSKIYLLTVYSKKDHETISKAEIKRIIKTYL